MSKSVKLSFQTGAENISDLELVGIRGTERISELYQIELVLSCKSLLTETQQKTLLQSPCAIGIGAAERQGKLHGILADLRAVDLSMNS